MVWSCFKPYFSQSPPNVPFLRVSRTLWNWGRRWWVQVAALDPRKSRTLLVILNSPLLALLSWLSHLVLPGFWSQEAQTC